jgi:hypothetical protein
LKTIVLTLRHNFFKTTKLFSNMGTLTQNQMTEEFLNVILSYWTENISKVKNTFFDFPERANLDEPYEWHSSLMYVGENGKKYICCGIESYDQNGVIETIGWAQIEYN